jgi:hypothetical protein
MFIREYLSVLGDPCGVSLIFYFVVWVVIFENANPVLYLYLNTYCSLVGFGFYAQKEKRKVLILFLLQ